MGAEIHGQLPQQMIVAPRRFAPEAEVDITRSIREADGGAVESNSVSDLARHRGATVVPLGGRR